MTKFKIKVAVMSGLILASYILVGGAIAKAENMTSMVGLVSFSTESNAVVGMITSTNRGMGKMISYQIPQLSGVGPYTFYAPYALAVNINESTNQASNMHPGNGMGNGRGSDNMMDDDKAHDGHRIGSGNMMDDEDDDGFMRGEWSHMIWAYDTYITLTNTSGINISVNATFYDNNGNMVKETTFDLTPHQTIQESVFEILGLR